MSGQEQPRESDSRAALSIGLGYTLASGRLFAPMRDFHVFAEMLLRRPILTHEFADEAIWTELRETYEANVRTAGLEPA